MTFKAAPPSTTPQEMTQADAAKPFQLRRRLFAWTAAWVAAWCLLPAACSFTTLDTKGFPCETDDACTEGLACLRPCDQCLGRCVPPGTEWERLHERPSEPDPALDAIGADDGSPDPTEPSSEQPPEPDASAEGPFEIPPEPTPDQPAPFMVSQVCKGAKATCLLAQFQCGDGLRCGINAVTRRDAQGALYIGGHFQTTLKLDGGQQLNAVGGVTLFLLKLRSDGTIAWHKIFGSDDNSSLGSAITNLFLDDKDNLYLAANVMAPLVFEGKRYGSQPGDKGILLARFNAKGALSWHKYLNGAGTENSRDFLQGPQGHIYLAGTYNRPFTMEGTSLATPSGYDVFLASWESSGTFRWVVTVTATGNESLARLAWVQEQLWLLGSGFRQLPIRIGASSVGTSQQTQPRFALLAFDRSGKLGKSYFSGGGTAIANSLFATTSDGDFLVYSELVGQHQLFGQPCGKPGGQETRLAIARIGADGKARWCHSAQGGSHHAARSLALSPSGEILLTGEFRQDINLAEKLALKATNNVDGFLAAIDGAGRWLWALQSGGDYNDPLYTIQPDASQQLLVSGKSSVLLRFGQQAYNLPPDTLYVWRLPSP